MYPKFIKRVRNLYTRSPQSNLQSLKKWFRKPTPEPPRDRNQVLEALLQKVSFPDLLAYKLRALGDRRLVLLGDKPLVDSWNLSARCGSHSIDVMQWDWSTTPDVKEEAASRLVICAIPTKTGEWEVISQLKKTYPAPVITLSELMLPFTLILTLQEKLNYYIKSFDEIVPHYLGTAYFGPFHELDAVFPIQGQRVIEFGPFDGCQTAGLVNLGAKSVHCVEARAENYVKTTAALAAFGWDNVRVLMDDFHNADAAKYGRYDLAFAHGVYYHSVEPFVFLENLTTLADNLFIGGFCATVDSPLGEFTVLRYQGVDFRVKQYREVSEFTAGVNSYAYFFHADDLQRFFTNRGFTITPISDEPSTVTAGQYLRFLARR